jgi:glycosyltransferase involved in cell wall biosynthesis
VASPWLAKTLRSYFGPRGNICVVENAVNYLFEYIFNKLHSIPRDLLASYICRHIDSRICEYKYILVSPLPEVFKVNISALEELTTRSTCNDILILVTGIKKFSKKLPDNVILLGYLPYVHYVTLISIANGMILPYPFNALCGGARNKVLEAGYAGLTIYTTKTGMLHIPVEPGIHYILITANSSNKALTFNSVTAENMRCLIMNRYTFKKFQEKLFKCLLKFCL